MRPLLPPRNRTTLPRPRALPPMTDHNPNRRCPGRRNKSRRNRNRLKRRYNQSRHRRRTRDGKGTYQYGGSRATLLNTNRRIKQRPRLQRRLPRRYFLTTTMSRRQRLKKATTHHCGSQPTFRRPNNKKSTSVYGTSFTYPRPTLRIPRPTTPTTSLINHIPSDMIRNLNGTTRRTNPRRGTDDHRRPHHTYERPPHHRSNRGTRLSLNGGNEIPIQGVPNLTRNRRGRNRHKRTINPRGARHHPLPSNKAIRNELCRERRLIYRHLNVNFKRTSQGNILLHHARQMGNRTTYPNRPMRRKPISNRYHRRLTPRNAVRPSTRPPIRVGSSNIVRTPTTRARSTPTRYTRWGRRRHVLSRDHIRNYPIPLGRRLGRQRRVSRRHLTRGPRSNGKIRTTFIRQVSSTET